MASLNSVTLMGNLTRDPESRDVGDSTVCNFGLAMNRKYKSKSGEMKEDATFIDIEAWGRTAELCAQYLSKGQSVLIEGRLKADSWEKDGEKRTKVLVNAMNVQFLTPKSQSDGGSKPADDDDSSLPF